MAIESVHWEHYCERVENIDMPNLDEGNFLAGCASVFISMIVSLVGVAIGAHPSPWLIMVFVALLLSSGVGTVYFLRQYRSAKKLMKKTGTQLAKEMREVAAHQQKLMGNPA